MADTRPYIHRQAPRLPINKWISRYLPRPEGEARRAAASAALRPPRLAPTALWGTSTRAPCSPCPALSCYTHTALPQGFKEKKKKKKAALGKPRHCHYEIFNTALGSEPPPQGCWQPEAGCPICWVQPFRESNKSIISSPFSLLLGLAKSINLYFSEFIQFYQHLEHHQLS